MSAWANGPGTLRLSTQGAEGPIQNAADSSGLSALNRGGIWYPGLWHGLALGSGLWPSNSWCYGEAQSRILGRFYPPLFVVRLRLCRAGSIRGFETCLI